MNVFPLIKTGRIKWMDVFLVLFFSLSNITAFRFWFEFWILITAYSFTVPQLGLAGVNCLLWLISLFVIYACLRKQKNSKQLFVLLKNQKPLLVFLGVSFFSIFWSINPWISSYKFFLLVASTIVGIFVGYRYRVEKITDLLFWFFSILLIFCLALAVLKPGVGTMEGYPYFGAWCGLFWNRNHLGSLAALSSSVFLIRIFSQWSHQQRLSKMDLPFYFLSLFIVYQAESATGIILTAMLSGTTLLLVIWQRFREKIQKKHYIIFAILFAVIAVVAILRLDLIFALVNRKPSLTGRIPMWEFLKDAVIGDSPWIGYGFGAIWSTGMFREGLRQAVNWAYPLLIADNGYLDIILSMGIIGFIPFLFILIKAWIHSIKRAISSVSISELFPVIFMLYVLVTNISFSMFFETETFIWILLVAFLVQDRTN